MVEIGENDILRKKTSNLFYGIKNRQNRTWFRGEIMNWSGENFRNDGIVILSEIVWNWKLNPNLN